MRLVSQLCSPISYIRHIFLSTYLLCQVLIITAQFHNVSLSSMFKGSVSKRVSECVGVID